MLFRGDVGSGHEGSRVYLEVCNIALILACSRTSVCIGFVVSPSTITLWHDGQEDRDSFQDTAHIGHHQKCLNLATT